jgi:hypothetical protein
MELIQTMFNLLPNRLLEPTPDGALGSYWVGVPNTCKMVAQGEPFAFAKSWSQSSPRVGVPIQEPFAARIMVAVGMAISRPSA